MCVGRSVGWLGERIERRKKISKILYPAVSTDSLLMWPFQQTCWVPSGFLGMPVGSPTCDRVATILFFTPCQPN